MEGKIDFNIRKSSSRIVTAIMFLCFVMTSWTSSAKTGEEIFTGNNCGSCHSLSDKRLVGPGLNGLLDRRDPEWIAKWITNSQEFIASGDETAVKLFEQFNNAMMPAYNFSEEEMAELIKYIDENGVEGDGTATAASGGGGGAAAGGDEASNFDFMPIFWGLLCIAIAVFFTYRFRTRIIREMNNLGVHAEPHHVKNYPAILAMYLLIALAVIFILVKMLMADLGMINLLMFLVLPYLAIGIFLVGSIYRYTKKGFKVSSLSSQFLEGKKLFIGSQPFHWGLLVLFFGHLIAFLFPSAVLAWNGQPMRLLILEISSFAFGLSALWGLVMLIIRRMNSKMLLVVSNKMDMVVYTILLVQIVSGLGVAFNVRWGSSWFASVITPYLRSVFSFDPDISAVAEMPWWIQLHIISAFSIIAIIPFTRFMHFLVAPIDYVWRKYQVVIWNWNRKDIRSSTRHTYGKKSRNH